MNRRARPLRDFMLSPLCILFGMVTRLLPLQVARVLGRVMGGFAYMVIPRVRRVTLSNLALAYGDTVPEQERKRIAVRVAQNVGIIAAEFSRTPLIDPAFMRRHVHVSGFEHIAPVLNSGKGVVLVSAHLGNWEWLAPLIRELHPNTAEIVRPLDAPWLNAYIDRTRTSTGIVTIDKEGAGAEMLKFLRQGYIVGILIDQSPRENGVPTLFFGQPCWATIAPVMAAVRARAPIHTISLTREDNGRYVMAISPELPLTRTGNLHQDIIANTQTCQDSIEAMVRACPEQWLWLHRRWKNRPRLEAEWEQKLKRDHGKSAVF